MSIQHHHVWVAGYSILRFLKDSDHGLWTDHATAGHVAQISLQETHCTAERAKSKEGFVIGTRPVIEKLRARYVYAA